MKNLFKAIIAIFISVSFLVSCRGENPTNWIFVDKTEVDKLLSSPEQIDLFGKKIKLEFFAHADVRRGGYVLTSPTFTFALVNADEKDINLLFNKNVFAKNVWIINKQKNFYFKPSIITPEIYNETFTSPYSKDYLISAPFLFQSSDDDIGICEFTYLPSNESFFIKTKIINNEKNAHHY